MRIAVAYDSVYGNTKIVAEAIAQQAVQDGCSSDLLNLRKDKFRDLEGDVLFVGGPTHMGGMTHRVRRFLKRVDREYWGRRTLVAFDTYGPVGSDPESRRKAQRWIEPGAVGGIITLAQELGLPIRTDNLRCLVAELRGPLVPDALSFAKKFTHELLAGNEAMGGVPLLGPHEAVVGAEP